MTSESETHPLKTYSALLKELLDSGEAGPDSVAIALSGQFIAAGTPPHEIVAVSVAAIAELTEPDNAPALVIAQRLLLDVMIAYGVAYSALAERLLAEASTAAVAEDTRVQDADRADKERLELLAGVSHELGAPLTVVKGNVLAIRRFLEAHQSWPEELTQRQDDVEFAVERMLALREELLAASRNQVRDLDIGPLHLLRCLQRVVRWARLAAADRGIQLTEEHAATLPYVLGDDGAVQSIFTNLLSNAVRYTAAGGTITVRTRNVDGYLEVEIADTGIGISESEQQRIFERFYRAPQAQQVASFGLGLGLAITRDLVSALGGTIKVSSQPGAGSTFTVALPLTDMAKEED
ncbi:MAG: ATP-binding protein [Dehalococcoidia bacterium]